MINESTPYPVQTIEIIPFTEFGKQFPKPSGLVSVDWPPLQATYLQLYLAELQCETVVIESHYIDRDFIFENAAFYSRSLRNYPNHCSRLHFFSCKIAAAEWGRLFDPATSRQDRSSTIADLQKHYLGFMVMKPLPGSPVGRTVLKTYPVAAAKGTTRVFGGIRPYHVHLAGYKLTVDGLAFQQQDQGVSACATTALWSSLQKVAHEERISVPTPAEITEAASRYLLAGRSLPSKGLIIEQLCEAIRESGLQPQTIKPESPRADKARLVASVNSGVPPVLAIKSLKTGEGHAICCVGFKMGDPSQLVSASAEKPYSLISDSVEVLYIHDDRLGPYASAQIVPWTVKYGDTSTVRTAIQIQWPDKTESEFSLLLEMIVPVPDKVRMPINRVLEAGEVMAGAIGTYFTNYGGRLVLNASYQLSTSYREEAFEFGLSKDGLRKLCCETALPRFLGLIRLSVKDRPLFDVLLDTTETDANPSVLLFVRRGTLDAIELAVLQDLAGQFGAGLVL